MPSYKRSERVSRLLKEEVSRIIRQEIKDPRVGFVTVTGVDVSADLRHANIFISIYGDDESVEKSMEGLNKSASFIRREIGERIKLRYVPAIHFKYDESIERASRIFKSINEIKKNDKKETK